MFLIIPKQIFNTVCHVVTKRLISRCSDDIPHQYILTTWTTYDDTSSTSRKTSDVPLVTRTHAVGRWERGFLHTIARGSRKASQVLKFGRLLFFSFNLHETKEQQTQDGIVFPTKPVLCDSSIALDLADCIPLRNSFPQFRRNPNASHRRQWQ